MNNTVKELLRAAGVDIGRYRSRRSLDGFLEVVLTAYDINVVIEIPLNGEAVKYEVDTTTQPDRINLFDFNRGILKDKILIGIIEPHGQDSILLDFKPVDSWAEADSARPKSFDPLQLRYLVRK